MKKLRAMTGTFSRLAALAAPVALIVAVLAVRSATAQPTSITYFIADGTGQTGFHASDPQLARWALEAWQRSATNRLRFEAAGESSALIRLYWIEPNSGRYGEAQPLRINGRRGSAVFIQPDVTSLSEELAPRVSSDPLLRDSIVYLTCLHELGHALGLAHTRDFRDIMYFFGYGGNIVDYFDRYRTRLRSREDISSVSGLSEADVNRLRSLYEQK